MKVFIKDFFNTISIFDLIFILIMVYMIIQCTIKGFTLSLISFMKWILALVLTIYLVPKFQPWVSDYIDSPFINNVGLGILIFLVSLFLTVMIGKVFRSSMKWTGFGPMDKTFGLFFGFFKGYVVSVCIFTAVNWFYPFNNWDIDVNKAISFNLIKNGSLILVDEFPRYEDLENTKEKIDKI